MPGWRPHREDARRKDSAMSTRRLVPAARAYVTALALAIAGSAGADEPGTHYFVPDVIVQFNALAVRPEALGFGLGGSPEPSICRHYQGMARAQGPGTPYLFVTRSGNDP